MQTHEMPRIGLVGSQGAYGRWLRCFFEDRMGLRVVGHDPHGDTALTERALIESVDVLIFCAPIHQTPSVIRHYVEQAAGAERGQLWLDITSIKAGPVAAMLTSQAEVVGLHPMSAAPKSATLRGRAMVVCEARLDRWRAWLERFLAATEADCVRANADQHDRVMALVQGMVHATHMAQGAVLRELAPTVGDLDGIRPFSSVGYELDVAVTRRILASNPVIYQDIQFENPYVAPMLERLAAHIDGLRDLVRQGDDVARERMRETLLTQSRSYVGEQAVAEGSYAFERLGYLLADLREPRYISVFLPLDRPGSLRALLSVFEQRGVNLDSIHSSRSAEGELLFRIGVSRECDAMALRDAIDAIAWQGIGRVVEAAGMATPS
ncbi:prephenate dehydrogenase [Dyella nitratireducens]|uniref:Prephenate dehydrogenase n=2 Tax=Dyella nitratireducens TaxID=1849580 RepID=A0ABQ1G270_9GAMM|nr:prephenate dehydrogenase [Dyella nitratireducens]GGA34580.1 prephenate dehydrogenase [Dyella nitratireducens]GLQ40886.1 prephenate dehydrogenase [Dyella nitratireducens]